MTRCEISYGSINGQKEPFDVVRYAGASEARRQRGQRGQQRQWGQRGQRGQRGAAGAAGASGGSGGSGGQRGHHCNLKKMPLCIYANGINI